MILARKYSILLPTKTEEGLFFMYKTTIILHSLEQAKQFVHICSAEEFNIELAAGNTVVHAKSIIGVLSMDLSTPMELTVKKGDPAAIEVFAAKLAPFIAE